MPEFVEIVTEKDKKPYEKVEAKEQKVPYLVLSKDKEKQVEELLGGKNALDKFKELLEEESEAIEDEHEAGLLQPNTWLEYNAMYGSAIERRNYFNLVFENLMNELKRHEEAPKEGDTPESIKQRVLNNLGIAVELAAKEAKDAIAEGGRRITGQTREEKLREIRKEAPGI